MLNAAEYVSAAKALGLDYVDKGYDTNFQKEIVRTGFVNSHHVALVEAVKSLTIVPH